MRHIVALERLTVKCYNKYLQKKKFFVILCNMSEKVAVYPGSFNPVHVVFEQIGREDCHNTIRREGGDIKIYLYSGGWKAKEGV